ncbi:hypothetical protein Nepgr_020078 [Nepenthes gracilis]|uniref:Uncharacterized protein n=1 Tax=Nepenthes gracilis TaxID=150966 RepID=A0AAD3XUP5_NEPGR|nr:hypothetical protein Nepgr_020078 [Nepenthes gracilis]
MAASSQLSNPKREWPSPPPAPTVEPQPSKKSNKISDTTDKIPDPPLIVQSLSQSTNQSITSPSLEDLFLSKSSHLTRQELLRRRLHHLKQLSRVYRDHYWALMEELRAQYREYYWKFGVSPYKDEEEREIGEREVNVEGSGETDNNNFNNVDEALQGLQLRYLKCTSRAYNLWEANTGFCSSFSLKLAPKFHVIVAEYVRQIQAKRRGAQRNSGDNIVTKKVLIGQPQDP